MQQSKILRRRFYPSMKTVNIRNRALERKMLRHDHIRKDRQVSSVGILKHLVMPVDNLLKNCSLIYIYISYCFDAVFKLL